MNNFKAEYKKYNDELLQWEKSICIPNKEPDRNRVEEILSYTVEQIREQETMILAEHAFTISQYLIFLQKKSNECDTYLKWIKNNNSKFFGDDKAMAGRMANKVELRQSRIAYLSRRIEFYCQAIQNIIRQRNMEYKNG
jgi:hypothetical protein